MKLEIKDVRGNQFDTEKVYYDINNNIDDVRLVEMEGEWYAHPDGLDPEPLKRMSMSLIEVCDDYHTKIRLLKLLKEDIIRTGDGNIVMEAHLGDDKFFSTIATLTRMKCEGFDEEVTVLDWRC